MDIFIESTLPDIERMRASSMSQNYFLCDVADL